MPEQPIRIFVSHSSKDQVFAAQLTRDLQQALGNEYIVWYDVHALNPGDTWWRVIVRELEQANVFLLVHSPDAMQSLWVEEELDIAWRRKNNRDEDAAARIRIIPLLYRPHKLRADLQGLQFISFLPPIPYQEAFQQLLGSLRAIQQITRPASPGPQKQEEKVTSESNAGIPSTSKPATSPSLQPASISDKKPDTTQAETLSTEDASPVQATQIQDILAEEATEEHVERTEIPTTTAAPAERLAGSRRRPSELSVIYVAPDDNLDSVRERLESNPSRYVALVIPLRTQLRSHVAWKWLYARARELGKDVLIITSDPQIRSVAQFVKFKVARSLEPSQQSKSRPPTRPGSTRPSGQALRQPPSTTEDSTRQQIDDEPDPLLEDFNLARNIHQAAMSTSDTTNEPTSPTRTPPQPAISADSSRHIEDEDLPHFVPGEEYSIEYMEDDDDDDDLPPPVSRKEQFVEYMEDDDEVLPPPAPTLGPGRKRPGQSMPTPARQGSPSRPMPGRRQQVTRESTQTEKNTKDIQLRRTQSSSVKNLAISTLVGGIATGMTFIIIASQVALWSWLALGVTSGLFIGETFSDELFGKGRYGVIGDIIAGVIGACISGYLIALIPNDFFHFWGSIIAAFSGACILIALLRIAFPGPQ